MNVNQTKTTCFVFACLAMLLLPFQLQAEGPVVEKPHTFSAGTPARASEVNANFDVAYEHIQKLLNVVCKYHPSEPLCQTTEPQETWTNDFGMTFVLIKPGTFVMGSPEGEAGRGSNEVQHSVTLTKSYYLQTTEVTQGQWKAVMGSNPSNFSSCGDNCPVEQVSWEDAQEFIEKLNLHETANRYQLPTEAQWEYAARAGSTTALANGNLVETSCGMDTNLNAMGWYCGNADSKTHPVAQKQANAWGLFDMHGNVWEWCSDWYGSYPDISVTDPGGASSGSIRVIRGGSWSNNAQYCRSAERLYDSPGYRFYRIGLRLSRTLKP
jgi:formylglycine-generating enzyme required for sulfatase activity